ncbi:type II secretion system F family protein [Leifsonia naganoensis]|uniref:Tight adherence protein B n=1 Tax=Leifsonia naganoensis TaxID=150025 RepID=A0A853DQN6_9MICO|nr:type II secretion system F family protein [Leifsonia naganoensis]NYK08874.1 tight adherence protein B [Leifsonia naganoensis]
MSRLRDREDEADRIASAAEGLAVLLDAGIAPSSAWRHVGRASPHPVVRQVAARIEGGSTVEDALAAEAGVSGSDGGVAALSAVWRVAVAAGSPLSPALRGAAAALRDRAEVAREVEVALSGPRSTARLVGWLPLVGLGFSLLLGVDVLGVLTGSPVGLGLLGAGGALGVVGRIWTAALVRRATPRGGVPGLEEELIVIALSSGLSIERSRRLAAEAFGMAELGTAESSAVDGVLELAERAGAPAAELLASAAEQHRRSARASGRRAAADLGVRLLLPLALCVLPSFLLLGVAPMVLGLISSTVEGF